MGTLQVVDTGYQAGTVDPRFPGTHYLVGIGYGCVPGTGCQTRSGVDPLVPGTGYQSCTDSDRSLGTGGPACIDSCGNPDFYILACLGACYTGCPILISNEHPFNFIFVSKLQRK